jgi:hypothetical protein
MGLFNVFKNSKSSPRTDLVWQTEEAKFKGCVDFLKKNKVDVCVAWFENTREKFNYLLNTQHNQNIQIALASTLFPFSLENKIVLFLEHYPLFSKEENLLGKAKATKVWFFNSLEDPILKIFSGNITQMMKTLGMEKDECLEHNLISKSIVNAQKKIEKKVWPDFYAKSGNDWINQFHANTKKAF